MTYHFRTLPLFTVVTALLLHLAPQSPGQDIRREYWLGVTGSDLGALTAHPDFPANWSGVDFPTSFEGPVNWQDNYGTRIRGYVHPPQTGEYTFWISGDDNSILYLSASALPAEATPIASVPTWTASREWDKFTEQQSVTIELEAGKAYYIEALHKEGSGGDNLAAGWQLPDGTMERPIPGARLSPFLISNDPPTIETQPTAGGPLREGDRLELRVVATGAEPMRYQWHRNGEPVPGEDRPLLVIDPLTLNDDDDTWYCALENPLGNETSDAVTLDVRPEIIPPAVVATTPAAGGTVRFVQEVEVWFSELVNNVDAADLLLNGQPALAVTGIGAGPYRFTFEGGVAGTAAFTWASGHGIIDNSLAENAFAGGGWQVVVNEALVRPDVVINEIVTSNSSGLLDEDGAAEDWIELRNLSAVPAPLNGWTLSDDEGDPGRWAFPKVTIPAGGYLVVFASGKDRRDPAGELHTNFKLSRTGEFLGLYHPELPHPLTDSLAPEYPEQRNDVSYGRAGGGWSYFSTPTPNAVNAGLTLTGITAPPHFSVPRGLYSPGFSLHLSAEPGAVIRYATDGGEPSSNNGAVYSGPIDISRTTILRAAAFKSGQLPSEIVTHSYFIGLSPALQSLPVLSVVTDVDNLFGPTGIMETDPRNTIYSGIDWERPVSAEWIRPGDHGGWAADVGMRIQGGGYVRERYDPDANLPFNKYSYRLYFRGDYGLSQLEYPLFPTTPVSSFDKIVLRAGMNDHSNPFIVDELCRRLFADTGHISAQGTLVNFFLNGEYKGYYNPTDRIDDEFLRTHAGGTNDWDVIAQFGEVREGDTVEWTRMRAHIFGADLSNPNNYATARSLLNIDNFIDYLLVNIYAAMGDWPHNNWRAARERIEGAKWNYILWDGEWGFGNIGGDVTDNTFNLRLNNDTDLARLFRSLLVSPEFRTRWKDRVQKHLFNDGALTDANISARYHELRDEMSGVLPNMSSLIHQAWIPQRRPIILQHMAQLGLYDGGNAPVFGQHGGRIPDGYELEMTAPGGTIYYTLNGGDPRAPATIVGESYEVLAANAPKRAIVPQSNAIGSSWRGGAEPFNDSGWASGTVGAGYESGSGYESFFDIDLQSQMLGLQQSAYVRIPFTPSSEVLNEADRLSLGIRYDDGFVAYLNGVRVASANAPDEGDLTYNSGATAGNSDEAAVQFASFDLTDALPLLEAGQNILAIHGLNSGTTSSDFLINATLTATRSEAAAPAAGALAYTGPVPLPDSVTVRARTLVDGEWSGLTEATFTVNQLGSPLRFTEIMYNPVGGGAYEFLELHNAGFASFDLSGATFEGIDFQFPAGTIMPGGAIWILASDEDPAAFATRYPGVNPAGYYGGALSNGGERIALRAANGEILAAVEYGDDNGWPTDADGEGASLTLIDSAEHPGLPSAWADGPSNGTPGILPAAPPAPAMRINELMAGNTGSVPHEGAFPDWIELHNASAATINLAGWGLSDSGDPQQFVFPAGTQIATGGYLVVWCDASTTSGIHTGFALNNAGENVSLYDPSGARVDVVAFGRQIDDLTLGRYPAESPGWRLSEPTPGAANVPASVAASGSLSINEWLIHPAPGQSAWVELHNRDLDHPAALHGLHLGHGDAVHQIREHAFLAPGGFVQLFTDARSSRQSLELGPPAPGSELALYDPTGALLESVNVGSQSEAVSTGRLPDGDASITSITSFPGSASPGAANFLIDYNGPTLNEVMALNRSATSGAFGGFPAWVEIRNPGGAEADLGGMGLSVDDTSPQWTFPAGSMIPANGYLVVWLDDEQPPSTTAETDLNGGLSLPARGGVIRLFDAAQAPVQEIVYGHQIHDQSIGVSAGAWTLLATPTPGSANGAAATLGSPSALRFNEWLTSNPGGADWLELHNTADAPVSLTGLQLADRPSLAGVDAPPLGPLSYIGPRGFVEFTADGDTTRSGHVGFSLNASGEHLRLFDGRNVLDTVDFGPQPPDASTGRLPDGTDTFVTFEATKTPGAGNFLPLPEVWINEVLTHTDPPLEDAVEIFNAGDAAIDVGGWYLSDRPEQLDKFRIADGTTIQPGGFLVIYQQQFDGGAGSTVPFAFSSARGEHAILSEVDGTGEPTGYRSQVEFGPALNGVSFGRYETSVGVDFVPLSARTFGVDSPATVGEFRTGDGAVNAAPLIGPLVISEIHADPAETPVLSDAQGEFLELLNLTDMELDLFDADHPDNTWRLRGGIEATLPSITLAPTERVVLVNFDPVAEPLVAEAFRDHYQVKPEARLIGPFAGRLADEGELVRLERPDAPETSGPDVGLVPYVEVEAVDFRHVAPWPEIAAGSGASLQRIDPDTFGNEPLNWRSGLPTGGGPNVSTADEDNDFIPDYWERTHGLNPNFAGDAGLDSDLDGVSNRDEFIAGTDPRDASSYLRVTLVGSAPGERRIAFVAKPGRSYTILYRDSLDAGGWTRLTDVPSAFHQRTFEVTDPGAGEQRYYRLVTPVQP